MSANSGDLSGSSKAGQSFPEQSGSRPNASFPISTSSSEQRASSRAGASLSSTAALTTSCADFGRNLKRPGDDEAALAARREEMRRTMGWKKFIFQGRPTAASVPQQRMPQLSSLPPRPFIQPPPSSGQSELQRIADSNTAPRQNDDSEIQQQLDTLQAELAQAREEVAKSKQSRSLATQTLTKLASFRPIEISDLHPYGLHCNNSKSHIQPKTTTSQCPMLAVNATPCLTSTEVLRDLLEVAHWQKMGAMHMMQLVNIWHWIECTQRHPFDLSNDSIVFLTLQLLGKFKFNDLTAAQSKVLQLMCLRLSNLSVPTMTSDRELDLQALSVKLVRKIRVRLTSFNERILILIIFDDTTTLPFLLEPDRLTLFKKNGYQFIDVKVNGGNIVLLTRGLSFRKAEAWFQDKGCIVNELHNVIGMDARDWSVVWDNV